MCPYPCWYQSKNLEELFSVQIEEIKNDFNRVSEHFPMQFQVMLEYISTNNELCKERGLFAATESMSQIWRGFKKVMKNRIKHRFALVQNILKFFYSFFLNTYFSWLSRCSEILLTCIASLVQFPRWLCQLLYVFLWHTVKNRMLIISSRSISNNHSVIP